MEFHTQVSNPVITLTATWNSVLKSATPRLLSQPHGIPYSSQQLPRLLSQPHGILYSSQQPRDCSHSLMEFRTQVSNPVIALTVTWNSVLKSATPQLLSQPHGILYSSQQPRDCSHSHMEFRAQVSNPAIALTATWNSVLKSATP